MCGQSGGRTDPFPFCRKACPLLAQPEIPNLRIRDKSIGLPSGQLWQANCLLVAMYGFRCRNAGSKLLQRAVWSHPLNTRA